MGVINFVLDKYAGLSTKQPMSDSVADRAVARLAGWSAPSWTGEDHTRRLTAYLILSAYVENSSRHFLQTSDPGDRDERREYGDAALVVDQTLAHLLGESQEIVVPGAEDYDAELDRAPVATDENPNPVDDRNPADLEANAAALVLVDRQAFLRQWARDVHLGLRLADCERNAVKLGDGVWILGWDQAKQRVVPSVMDPGAYFPVLPETFDSYDYPETVHFAWELPAEDFPDNKQRVRRITYRLEPITPRYDEVALLNATTPEEFDAALVLPRNATVRTRRDPAGFEITEYVRLYPWDDEPSTRMCTLTDATWKLDDLNDASKPDAFSLELADIRRLDDGTPLDRYDLGIDFVPVVHQPNTPAGGDHYGDSSLTRVLQLLDDIQNADTDAQRSAATTGSPIIGISGASTTAAADPLTGIRGSVREVKPGTVWPLGENGRLDVADTSSQLQATREYVKALLDRLSVNARLPAAVLGRMSPAEVPSGFAMQLSFGPLTSMIRSMRLVRSVKHPLLLKMTQRLYQANGILPAGPTPDAEIQLGAYLPSDMAGVLEQVTKAYAAKVISLETAVTMLLEVGFSVDDVAEEIARIEHRDYEGANALADATGDTEVVMDYLGLDYTPPGAQAVPEVVVPPEGDPQP